MKIKILILGSTGMAGHMISNYLARFNNYEILNTTRENLNINSKSLKFDAFNYNELDSILKDTNPQYVINTIGILNSDAENNPEKAILINSFLPHYLANICSKYNSVLIQISTDCVFSGNRGAYLENDFLDGIGIYSKTKSLGEVTYGKHITLRTSIIGPDLKEDGIGLFNWVFKQKNNTIGFAKAYWSGVTTLQLAKAISYIINLKTFNYNLVHLTNNNKISKLDLIRQINQIFHLELDITANNKYKVDKSLINSNKNFKFIVPSYEEMLVELYKWMIDNKEIYKNYKLK
jgi:dTDP-4-dehydrorhamnose reductase